VPVGLEERGAFGVGHCSDPALVLVVEGGCHACVQGAPPVGQAEPVLPGVVRIPSISRKCCDVVWIPRAAPGHFHLPSTSRGVRRQFRADPALRTALSGDFRRVGVRRAPGRGERFSTLTDFDVPPLDTINPPFDVDGHSHFPVFIADNIDFGPPDANPFGLYRWQFEMIDQSGAGWRIEARFVVRR
jgi:hypothetical protein